MMNRSVSTGTDYRERVVTFLALMASQEAREAVSRWIDRDSLAFELCRVWFDDVYVVSRRYFDGLKGDFSEAAAERFRSAFSEEELAALERFSRFLELRLEMLPEESLASRRIHDNDAWQNLVRHAVYLLDDLEPDAAARRTRLAEHLSDLDVARPGSPTLANDAARLLVATIRRREG